MVVLRNREILPSKPTPKPLTKQSTPEPVTPTQIREPSTSQSPSSFSPNLENHRLGSDSTSRRRSLRLASKSVPFDGSVQNGSLKRKCVANMHLIEEKEKTEESNIVSLMDHNAKDNDVDGNFSEVLSLRSGKRVAKRRVGCSGHKEVQDEYLNVEENGSPKLAKGKGKGKLGAEVKFDVEQVVENVIENVIKQMKGEIESGKMSEMNVVNEKLEDKQGVNEREETGKKVKGAVVVIDKLEKNQSSNGACNSRGRGRYSKEEKGKGMLVDDTSVSDGKEALELESVVKNLVNSLKDSGALENGRETMTSNTRMEHFRDVARKNASRFAHFENQEQEEEHLSVQVDEEMPSVEENQAIEDWPGPFSTAMKIIRDRAKKLNLQQGNFTSEKAKSVPITWVPRISQGSNRSRVSIPSLQELCTRILVKNSDAVTSLEHVPDALRHRLCQMLCNCKRMNSHFLDLLVHGSPTEIRIKDCSWLTEEDFVKCFEGCDTNNLTVLQLDQCGRCLTDYVLPSTLARSSRSLGSLITLSLAGACRLSDIGLNLIVSSAPALRSINLSQCSLLTSASIGILADSLGSVLRELYIDDCQGLNSMLILPTLKKLRYLEVLSLAGNQTICDDFVREFLVTCGHNMKELVLTDCVKLTDSSMEVIAETCPGLCALDLVNLRKLTDSSLGHLANGCQKIQTLKLCCNSFSDEAIAAFVETSGELLKELSLNNVKKVGNNTALSLSKRARNLLSLDLSWCRNLTDEAVGLIVDSCPSLRVLKLFGCGQITNVFLDGHSNKEVEIIGLKMSPVLECRWVPDSQEFPLRYSSVPSM